MKNIRVFLLTALFLMVSIGTSFAGPYSSLKVFRTFGGENVCLGAQAGCIDGDSEIKLNTDDGFQVDIIPVGVRQGIKKFDLGELGIRGESVVSVSKREFSLKTTMREQTYTAEGDDTRFSVGGQIGIDFKTKVFTPYVMAGAGIEYVNYSVLVDCQTGEGGCGPLRQMESGNDMVFYKKALAGVDIPISDLVSLNFEGFWKHADRARMAFPGQANGNLDNEYGAGGGFTLYY